MTKKLQNENSEGRTRGRWGTGGITGFSQLGRRDKAAQEGGGGGGGHPCNRCNADRGRFHLSLPTEDEELHTQWQALTKASRLDNDTHQGERDQPTRRVSLGFTALVVLRILLLRRLLNSCQARADITPRGGVPYLKRELRNISPTN
jgi:hypothetical protein